MIKLSNVLSSRAAASAFESASFSHFQGEIETDQDPSKFRLYSTPRDRRAFFLIDTKDVQEVYEWTPEELAYRGFVGHKMYTVPLKYGSVIQVVAIRNITVGVPASGTKAKTAGCDCRSQKPGPVSTRDCNYSASCAADYPDNPCLDGDVCDNCCIA